MNINFQAISGLDNNDSSKAYMEVGQRPVYKPEGSGLAKGSAYAVNLNSNIFNNDVYGEKSAKTAETIMDNAANKDISLEENYKVLMSNTMSAEDYGKAAEEGFDFNELDPETAVTILDKIKAVVAEAGTSIEGYNDDLNIEQLTKITGSRSLATSIKDNFKENDLPLTRQVAEDIKSAFDRVSEIESLSESTMRYMTANQVEPTIDNFYMSVHSTNGQTTMGRGYYAQDSSGYFAQKADVLNWDQIKDQAQSIVEEAGFDVDNIQILEDARWIIEQGLPLTTDNLTKMEELKNISFPVEEDKIVKAAINAIVSGKKVEEANLSEEENLINKALRIKNDVDNISDEAIREIVSSGKKININNLILAAVVIDSLISCICF